MKVLDYINKKSADHTVYIISKNSLAVVSSSDYATQQRKLYAAAVQHAENQSRRSRNNRRGKNNFPNTIYYGKVQYLLKNKGMMSWISNIDILEEISYPAETVKVKKESELPELELIEI